MGLVPIRAYALCILAGIIVAVLITQRRWTARGGRSGDVLDVAIWAVPFGIVGGRLYHVITDPELYFAAGKQPIRALYIWDGGRRAWCTSTYWDSSISPTYGAAACRGEFSLLPGVAVVRGGVGPESAGVGELRLAAGEGDDARAARRAVVRDALNGVVESRSK